MSNFFKIRLGALIPRSVDWSSLSVYPPKITKKNYKTLQNLTKHQSISMNDWKRTNLTKDDLKNENDLKMKTAPKVKTTSKNEDNLKNEEELKKLKPNLRRPKK